MRIAILSCFLLAIWICPVYAKTMYTSDVTEISVRQGSDTSYPIVATLKSGQQLNVLESTHGWSKVQLADGRQGWLVSSYLTDEKPNDGQPMEYKKKNDETSRQLQEATAETEQLKKENQTLKTQLQEAIKNRPDGGALKAVNPIESQEYKALKTKFDQMSSELAEKTKKIKELEQLPASENNAMGSKKYYLYFFLAGAGVLLIGMIIGSSGRKRRSSLL